MTAPELIVVALAVFFASLVQVTSGFGFGLLSVPVMTLAIPAREAVVVSTILGVCVSGWQAWRMRAHADRVLVRRMTIAAHAGMPLGLWVFVAVDDRVLKLVLGGAVLVAVVALAMQINLHHVGPGLDVAAGFVSGVLNTSVSTNGPPLVFVLQARRLAPDVFRGTLARIFTLCAFVAFASFVAVGKVTRGGLLAAAIALPAMLVGQFAGLPLRAHIHGERFRLLVLALLAAAAVSAIVAALG